MSFSPEPLGLAAWFSIVATVIAAIGEVFNSLVSRQKSKWRHIPIYSSIGIVFDALAFLFITLMVEWKNYNLLKFTDPLSSSYGLVDLNAIYSVIFLLIALLFHYIGFLKDSNKILAVSGALITTIIGVILLIPLVVILFLIILSYVVFS